MEDNISNEPQEYAVTISVLVKADSFMELRKRVTALQDVVERSLRSNPNTDGYYIGVDEVFGNIKPPVSKHSSESDLGNGFEVPNKV